MRHVNVIDVSCPSCGAARLEACRLTRPDHDRGRACPQRVTLFSEVIRLESGLSNSPEAPPRGYHVANIARGTFGEVSKIEEEFREFMDAHAQGVAVMQLVELSDLIGAIEGWLSKYHPSVTISHLCKMKDVTKRAFTSGHRKSR